MERLQDPFVELQIGALVAGFPDNAHQGSMPKPGPIGYDDTAGPGMVPREILGRRPLTFVHETPGPAFGYDVAMTIPVTPLVLILIGALLWVFARPAKLAEAGKLMFFAGVLALAFGMSVQTLRL